MGFPSDRHWIEAADVVSGHGGDFDRVLGHELFTWRFVRARSHDYTHFVSGASYDWAILHKGMLDEIHSGALLLLDSRMIPVAANEVFVVLTSRADVAPMEMNAHLASYRERFRERVAATVS